MTPHRNNYLWRILLVTGSLVAILILGIPPVALFVRMITNQAWNTSNEPEILTAVLLSLQTTTLSALITLMCGVPLAYVLHRYRFPLRWLVNIMTQIPIVLPPSVAGLALLLAFGRRGILAPIFGQLGIAIPFTIWAVILVQVFVALPFLVRTTQIGLTAIASEIEDAASVDGAAGFSLFVYVILPLTRRSILIGLSLAWTRALGEFGATILFAGRLSGETQTLPLFVYGALEQGQIDVAIWAGIILITIALIIIGITFLLTRGSDESDATSFGKFFVS